MAQTDIRTVYKLKAFDSAAAMAGALCVMYKKEDSNNNDIVFDDTSDEVSNIIIDTDGTGSPNEYFMGAGVCTFKEPNKFLFLLDSKYYAFNEKGYGANGDSLDYRLWLAELGDQSKKEIRTVGRWIKVGMKATNEISLDNVIPVDNSADAGQAPTFEDDATPIGDGGSTIPSHDEPTIDPDATTPTNRDKVISDTEIKYIVDGETTESNTSTIQVDSLNARDEFATQVLNGMLNKLPSPAGLSDNEMNYYCNAAYQWAANMMAASARARSFDKDNTSSSASMEQTTALESNTEKLLHNLVVATGEIKSSLQRTDEATTTGSGDNQTTSYAERVTLKDVTMSSIQALIDQQRGKYTDSNDVVQYRGKSAHEQAIEGTLTELKNVLDAYTDHTSTGEGDTKTKVGLDDLIIAINAVTAAIAAGGGSGGGGGSVSGNTEVSFAQGASVDVGITSGAGYSSNNPFVMALVNDAGQGNSASNPLYISGGGFPTKNAVAQQSLGDSNQSLRPNSFLTFNGLNTAGWANVSDVANTLLNYFSSAATDNLKDYVITKLKGWLLDNTTTVTINGTSYKVINNGALN